MRNVLDTFVCNWSEALDVKHIFSWIHLLFPFSAYITFRHPSQTGAAPPANKSKSDIVQLTSSSTVTPVQLAAITHLTRGGTCLDPEIWTRSREVSLRLYLKAS